MNLIIETFNFVLLTPCFSGTAEGRDGKVSELRVPPIRGQIRFWHREAYDPDSANRIWGSATGNNEGQGSRIAVRLKTGLPPSKEPAQLLPHKPHGPGSRPAFPAGACASIQLQRLPSCNNDDWGKALTATKLWLLVGTLGYRSTRAAGSVWPGEPWAPRSREELVELLAPLIARPNQPAGVALIAESVGRPWAELRETASDTPKGPPDLFGNAQPRKPSPVRFKVIELANGLCLLAYARSRESLEAAEAALQSKPDPRRWNALGAWRFL